MTGDKEDNISIREQQVNGYDMRKKDIEADDKDSSNLYGVDMESSHKVDVRQSQDQADRQISEEGKVWQHSNMSYHPNQSQYYGPWVSPMEVPFTAPYIAPPSPVFSTPYYSTFPGNAGISGGVPISSYPFTLEMAIVHQIEWYLGEENLAKDKYLRQLMDENFWVEIEKLVTFPKLSRLTSSVRLIARVMREFSFQVQVDEDGLRVRPKPADCNEDKYLVILKNVAAETTKEEMLQYLESKAQTAVPVRILADMDGTWFAYCENDDQVEQVCIALSSFNLHGNIVEARRKGTDLSFQMGQISASIQDSSRFGWNKSSVPFLTASNNAWSLNPSFTATSLPAFGGANLPPFPFGMYPFMPASYPYGGMLPFGMNTMDSFGATDTGRGRSHRGSGNRGMKSPERHQNGNGIETRENHYIFDERSQSNNFTGRRRNRSRIHGKQGNDETTNGRNSVVTASSKHRGNSYYHEGDGQRSRSQRDSAEQNAWPPKKDEQELLNLSLANFPPLPSAGDKKSHIAAYNSPFKNKNLNSGVIAEKKDVDGSRKTLYENYSKSLDSENENVCIDETESHMNPNYQTDELKLPILSFGDLVISSESLSEAKEEQNCA